VEYWILPEGARCWHLWVRARGIGWVSIPLCHTTREEAERQVEILAGALDQDAGGPWDYGIAEIPYDHRHQVARPTGRQDRRG